MSTVPELRLSPLEYLSRERAADRKSEFFQGRMYGMAGAFAQSQSHRPKRPDALGRPAQGRPCEVFPSDLRLSCPSGLMTYPDAQVICGKLEYRIGTDDTVSNPKVIIEVLSPATEAYDRGQKFAFYREIPSLQEYVLVSWQAPLIERFHRQSDGWLLTEAKGDAAVLNLPVIACTLPLAEVFRDVEFTAVAAGLTGKWRMSEVSSKRP